MTYILGGGGEQQGGVATILSQNITQNKHVMLGGEKLNVATSLGKKIVP